MQKEVNYMIHDTAEASSSCNLVCNIQQQIRERLDAAVLLTRGLPCSQMLIKMDSNYDLIQRFLFTYLLFKFYLTLFNSASVTVMC